MKRFLSQGKSSARHQLPLHSKVVKLDYLSNLWNHWNSKEYITLNDYNLLLQQISKHTTKNYTYARKWLDLGERVFGSCIRRTTPDESTYKSFLELLVNSIQSKKGETIEEFIKTHEFEITPNILISIIKGYIRDKNYTIGIERFEEYYYIKGFLNEPFYEEFIEILSKSDAGSLYALHELYYKIRKDGSVEITDKMWNGFTNCCQRIKSTEMMHLFIERMQKK